MDHVFALAPSGEVFRDDGYLHPSVAYTDEYANPEWHYAFRDIDAFWTWKVRFYLER